MLSKKINSVSAESLVVLGLARSPFVLTEHISSYINLYMDVCVS